MDALDLARWQFGITTVYHFLFVPVTIGLSAVVAGYETAWVRTRNPVLLRLTRFFGKLFLINFAIGVVTGIVQEFQFGMNWSDDDAHVVDALRRAGLGDWLAGLAEGLDTRVGEGAAAVSGGERARLAVAR